MNPFAQLLDSGEVMQQVKSSEALSALPARFHTKATRAEKADASKATNKQHHRRKQMTHEELRQLDLKAKREAERKRRAKLKELGVRRTRTKAFTGYVEVEDDARTEG